MHHCIKFDAIPSVIKARPGTEEVALMAQRAFALTGTDVRHAGASHKFNVRRPKPTNDTWSLSFQPPSEREWNQFVLDNPDIIARPDEPAEVNQYRTSFQSILSENLSLNGVTTMKMTIIGVPAGSYTGTFDGIQEKDADEERGYGPAVIWQFTIVGGPFDGQTATRITGATPTVKNACGKFLRAISGKQLAPGVPFDTDEAIGRRFHLIVVDAPSGNGTRVETCVADAG